VSPIVPTFLVRAGFGTLGTLFLAILRLPGGQRARSLAPLSMYVLCSIIAQR
jgi:hypothetical protein